MRDLRLTTLWLTLGWLLMIIVLTNAVLPSPAGAPGFLTDKQLHALVFVVLTMWFAGIYQRRKLGWLVVAMALFGALIEIAQAFVAQRDSSLADWVADLVGIAIAVALIFTGLDRWCEFVERRLRVFRG